MARVRLKAENERLRLRSTFREELRLKGARGLPPGLHAEPTGPALL